MVEVLGSILTLKTEARTSPTQLKIGSLVHYLPEAVVYLKDISHVQVRKNVPC